MMETLGDHLFQYGIAGIFILVLLYALNRVFNLYTDAQERRIGEKEALTVAIRNSTEAINGHTKAVEALTEIVKFSK